MSPALTSHAVQHPSVDFVSFTGSVVGGRAVEEAAVQAKGFKGVGLEVCENTTSHSQPLIRDAISLVERILPTYDSTRI